MILSPAIQVVFLLQIISVTRLLVIILINILISDSITAWKRMEKFLESAKAKCQKFKLRCQTNLAKSIGHLPERGFIDTSEGEMKVLTVKPDGNCQLRVWGFCYQESTMIKTKPS